MEPCVWSHVCVEPCVSIVQNKLQMIKGSDRAKSRKGCILLNVLYQLLSTDNVGAL